jgi:putative Ca2+/H+ antiporter (TMEM165/GDT1 family)
VLVASLAVTVGRWIVQHVPLRIVQRVAGVLFIGFGVVTIIAALT